MDLTRFFVFRALETFERFGERNREGDRDKYRVEFARAGSGKAPRAGLGLARGEGSAVGPGGAVAGGCFPGFIREFRATFFATAFTLGQRFHGHAFAVRAIFAVRAGRAVFTVVAGGARVASGTGRTGSARGSCRARRTGGAGRAGGAAGACLVFGLGLGDCGGI